MLRRSVTDATLGLPGFPSPDLQRRFIGSDGVASLHEVDKFFQLIGDHVDLSLAAPALDFGCGYGRMTRALLNWMRPSDIFAADTDAYALEQSELTGVPGTRFQIEADGRLPCKTQQFGLIFAYSVFTHLPEILQAHWLSELARVLRPGGVLVATVESPRVFDFFAEVDLSDKSIHPWLAKNAKAIQETRHSAESRNVRLRLLRPRVLWQRIHDTRLR